MNIIIIMIEKAALFEPQRSLEDSARFDPVFHFFGFGNNIFFFFTGHSYLPTLRPNSNLEDQVPVYMSPSDRVA
jgi:hypothetical protein